MKTRYVRPIANGSPWITCYRCYKLLELPQSFLVFNKKCHSLRCGACMEVLKFTLLNGTHVSRYYPEEAITAPPSSEVEDYNELNRSRAGPVSCSDVSFQKSYSTETDRNGFWEFGEERRKATMSRDPSGSSQPSSSKISGRRKMMSEIEVERRPNGSPLHRLMGYSTPSKVIRG
ncbi:putative zinc-ribbon domain, plant, protein enhanced disease resistance 4 [Helianthus anomalus]